MLKTKDREDLKWAMKKALIEQSAILTENKKVVQTFVVNEATYEQLINLVFNPYDRDEIYLEAEALEDFAKCVVYEMTNTTTEKKKLGKDLTIEQKFEILSNILNEANPGFMRRGYSAARGRIAGLGKNVGVGSSLMKSSPFVKGAAVGGALAVGAGAWYIYKKLRKAGRSRKEAAAAAAQAAARSGDPESAARWAAKARAA